MKKPETRLTLALFAMAILLQTSCSGNREPVDGLPWIPKDLASSARILNDRCPEMIDPESRLDSVVLFEEGLYFYYTLPNKEKDEIPSGPFTAYLMPGIVDNIQTNPSMEMFRDSSVVMLFRYLDRNGEQITEFSVGPERYLQK
jgi:hypothetical protein